VQVYDSVTGQLVLCIVVALYAAGVMWMRALARFPGSGAAAGRRRARGHSGRSRSGRGLAGRCLMTAAFLVGSLAGLGLFLLGLALHPPRPRLARRLALLRRGAARGERPLDRRPRGAGRRPPLASRLVAGTAVRRAGLGVLLAAEEPVPGRGPVRDLLATKVLLAVLGFVLGPTLGLLAGLLGVHMSVWIQVWLGLLLGAVFSFLPDLEIKQKPPSGGGTSGTRSGPSSTCSR